MLNQVAVITGSSRGIGAATARLMAAEGYAIVLNYLHSAGPAEALRQEISAMGVPCISVQADVSEEAQVEALFAQADALGLLLYWLITLASWRNKPACAAFRQSGFVIFSM